VVIVHFSHFIGGARGKRERRSVLSECMGKKEETFGCTSVVELVLYLLCFGCSLYERVRERERATKIPYLLCLENIGTIRKRYMQDFRLFSISTFESIAIMKPRTSPVCRSFVRLFVRNHGTETSITACFSLAFEKAISCADVGKALVRNCM